MERTTRVFASASYLGDQQEVQLEVRFVDRTSIAVTPTFDGPVRIAVHAGITGHEGRYNLVTDCLDVLRTAYENAQHEPPTKLLLMTWEKALRDAWRRVLG